MDKVSTIIWAETGIGSLEIVVDYISRDSEFYASNFARKITELVESLAFFPKLGRIVPEYNRDDLRELIYQNYRIVYKTDSGVISIVYVGHCAKKLPALSDLSQ